MYKYQIRIQNPVKHLRWSLLLNKSLMETSSFFFVVILLGNILFVFCISLIPSFSYEIKYEYIQIT